MSEKQVVSGDVRNAIRKASLHDAQFAVSEQVMQLVFLQNSLRESLFSRGPVIPVWRVVGECFVYGGGIFTRSRKIKDST